MVHSKRLALILLVCGVLAISILSSEIAEDLEDFFIPLAGEASAEIPEEIAESDTLTQGMPEAEMELYTEILPELDLDDVISLIDEYRKGNYPNDRYFDPINAPANAQSYRLSFDFAGLQNQPGNLKTGGFIVPASFLQSWTHQGYLSQFHILEHRTNGLDARPFAYEHPVSLSRLEGSLGDYDSRYALASFAKGDLFGIQGSGMQFDYTLYNGYWVDSPNSGNSIRQYLSYRHRDLLLSVDLASYQKDAGSYELNPTYWHMGNFRYNHSFSQVIGRISHPYLQISFASLSDRLSAPGFAEDWKSKSLHLAAEKNFQLPDTELGLRYEYRDLTRDFRPAMAYNQGDYHHIISSEINHESLVRFALETELMDWERWRTQLDLSGDIGFLRIGAESRFAGGHNPETIGTSPMDGSPMPIVDLYSPRENALYSQFILRDLSLKLSVGQRREEQSRAATRFTRDLSLMRLGASYDARYKDWQFRIDSVWNYLEYDQALMASPEFSFSSEQRIYRHLSHDNRLELGFALHGHSDYYLPNAVNPYLIEASTLVDAWAGVRISKLFDFGVSAKNILSTSIYGLYPVPLSIHANLRWFFVN